METRIKKEVKLKVFILILPPIYIFNGKGYNKQTYHTMVIFPAMAS